MRAVSILGAVLVAGAACSDAAAPYEPLAADSPRTRVTRFEHDGAQIRVETKLSHVFLTPGESVAITVTVVNESDRDVSFRFNSGCTFFFGIRSSGGDEVVSGDWLCPYNIAIVDLAPGEERSKTFYWDGNYTSTSGKLRRVRSGVYCVWGAFREWSGPVLIEVRNG